MTRTWQVLIGPNGAALPAKVGSLLEVDGRRVGDLYRTRREAKEAADRINERRSA